MDKDPKLDLIGILQISTYLPIVYGYFIFRNFCAIAKIDSIS